MPEPRARRSVKKSFRDFFTVHGFSIDDIRKQGVPSILGELEREEDWDTEPDFLKHVKLDERRPSGELTPRVGVAQVDIAYSDPLRNLATLYSVCKRFKKSHVKLVVFPECYLTGYCTPTIKAAKAAAIDWSSAEGLVYRGVLLKVAEQFDQHLIVGFAEREGDTLYNAACLVTPKGEWHEYRKSHLPEMGIDKFVSAGQDLKVIDTAIGRIGILICFDMRFPEAARILALQKADIIVIPTNWPVGAECSANHICIARAAENRVFVVTCNRVGEENGFDFIGRSKVIGPTGEVINELYEFESLMAADLNLIEARTKRTGTIPDKYATAGFARRPELYGKIVE